MIIKMVPFRLLVCSLFFSTISGFLRLPLGSPFNIQTNEIKRDIPLDLDGPDLEIVRQINGVYGLMGPDLNISDVRDLYHLFTGNGIVQACFFDRGELKFVKKYVRTDKIEYEQCYGKVLHHKLVHMIFYILNKVNVLPDIFGLANTALVKMGGRHFALYERDRPYEMMFDFKKKTVHIGAKWRIKGVNQFSAHPTVRASENLVETLEYNIVDKSLAFHQLTNDLVLHNTISTPMAYLPLVHDFVSTKYNFMVTDSPFFFKFSEIFKKFMPVTLSNIDPTYIRAVNKITGRVRTFESNESFAIFHYAQVREDENRVQLFAPVYEHVDFSELDIHGKYRCLTLDKQTGTISVHKNAELENLNLDFPVPFSDKIILRSMKNRICDGFVVCRDLEIVGRIELKDRFASGEPRVIYLRGSPYLLFFTFTSLKNSNLRCYNISNEEEGFVNVLSLDDYHNIEIPMRVPLKYGFHSFFVENL